MTENSSNQEMTIPNMLTLSRIALIPVFVGIVYLPYSWSYSVAAVIFLLAGLTDMLDGYLARKLNQTSKLGAFLDPVADKLMVAVALMLLVEIHASAWLAIPAMVIVSREIMVSALREWMAELGKRATISVSNLGKIKTTVQMVAIAGLLAYKPEFDVAGKVILSEVFVGAYVLLYLAMVLTLWSGVIYLKAAWPELRANR